MKLKMTNTVCLAFAFGLAASPAYAQMTWTDKAFVNVSFGVQGGSSSLETQSNFELYGEQGSLATSQEVGGGALFDLGAGYKVWRNLALGIGYSRSASDSDVAIAAQVPDPNIFDALRPLTGVASDSNHTENAVHIQATWMMPVTDKVDVGFQFGPTFFQVSQDVPAAITVTEPGPALASTTITREEESAVGFHLGIDATYLVTPRIGAGVLLRYSHGSVDLAGASDSTTVGGFQIGFGARFRF